MGHWGGIYPRHLLTGYRSLGRQVDDVLRYFSLALPGGLEGWVRLGPVLTTTTTTTTPAPSLCVYSSIFHICRSGSGTPSLPSSVPRPQVPWPIRLHSSLAHTHYYTNTSNIVSRRIVRSEGTHKTPLSLVLHFLAAGQASSPCYSQYRPPRILGVRVFEARRKLLPLQPSQPQPSRSQARKTLSIHTYLPTLRKSPWDGRQRAWPPQRPAPNPRPLCRSNPFSPAST